MSKLLISIVGATAIGKTKLAIALAKAYKTEIISADSRQFFKEMTIGTAVPSVKELSSAKHHFIQHKSVVEPYNVGDFERDGITLLNTLFKQYNIVIMVGGSGLYVDAITKGLDKFPKVDSGIRIQLNQDLQDLGITTLQKKLKELDESYYNTVDLNNPHRLIRALEICLGTGKAYSSYLSKPKKVRNFKTLTIGLQANRGDIYEAINLRVDKMMAEGLEEEVKSLLGHRDLNALKTVGYKELFTYFDGLWDYDTAVSEIKKNTRRFAKRQQTWFKKNENIFWIERNIKWELQLEQIAAQVNKLLPKLNEQ